jgi:hypothetical protein
MAITCDAHVVNSRAIDVGEHGMATFVVAGEQVK